MGLGLGWGWGLGLGVGLGLGLGLGSRLGLWLGLAGAEAGGVPCGPRRVARGGCGEKTHAQDEQAWLGSG